MNPSLTLVRARILASALLLLGLVPSLSAQVPQLLNYQGRVAVGTTPFTGTGQFKFALVSSGGAMTYWSNDGTSSGGLQPTAAVSLTVANGLYSLLLGDTSVPNMPTAIPASVFANSDVRLRVWFSDGSNGFQLLTPDQRIGAVGYAVMAGNVPDGAITSAKLAAGAVTATSIAAGTITSTQLAAGAAAANLTASGQSGVPSGGILFSRSANDLNLTGAGYVKLGMADLGIAWAQRASSPLGVRSRHTAVWTGTEMIVWGGYNGSSFLADGARYNPTTNAWTAVSASNAPSVRADHSAIWTGTLMVVWGGVSSSADLADGGRYDPATNTWAAVTTTNGPTGREKHAAVWTGTELVVWGGFSQFTSSYLNDGGRYNPTTGTWAPGMSPIGAPSARSDCAAIWTGSKMIIWGGINGMALGDGAKYDPVANTWAAMATASAPVARWAPAAVWTGTQMVLWGGYGLGSYNTGARYNPVADTWTATTTVGAPAGRINLQASWTGSEMLIWGGYDYNNGTVTFNDGARYNPTSDSWVAIPAVGAPAARYGHTSIWTGSEMLIWGGTDGTSYFNDIWSFATSRPMYLYQRP